VELDEFHVGDRRPRAYASATPSPVATSGLLVYRYTFPEPPVARTVASATKVWIAPVFLSST